MHKPNRFFIFTLILVFAGVSLLAQNTPIKKANYEIPARFTPNKMRKLVFSTRVDAHWLKHSDRFWYVYETSEGKTFWIVDPVKRTKRPIFDNIKMAALLTRMTMDPYDAQHLPIDSIKFKKNDTIIYFKVMKNKDVLDAEKRKEEAAKKKEDKEEQKEKQKEEQEKGEKDKEQEEEKIELEKAREEAK